MLSPLLWYRALVNAIAFPLRRRIAYSRAGLAPAPADPEPVIAAHPRQERMRALVQTYRPRLDHLDERAILEVLDKLHLLDRAAEAVRWSPAGSIAALDVGARDFRYAAALHAFWSRFAPVSALTGIELDPFQVLQGGHSRGDHGRWHAAQLPGTSFVAGDVRDLEGSFDAISMLLPFVHPLPLVAWGLPIGELRPEEIHAHVWNSLKTGGILILTNQEELEAELGGEVLARVGITPAARFAIDDPLLPQRQKWVTVAVKH